MRQISFALTTPQVRAHTKTVTRRLGWKNAKPGDVVQPIVKGQGLKKGEHVEKIDSPVRIIHVQRERLNRLLDGSLASIRDMTMEGFPDLSPQQFVDMFCQHNGCRPHAYVTRIEFEYTEPQRRGARA